MRLWILFCGLIGFAADVAALILLLNGYEMATLLVAIGCAVAGTAGAVVLLVIKPQPAAQALAESSLQSPMIFLESAVTSHSTIEPSEVEPLDNGPWLKLVEENVALFDELDRHRADLDALRQETADHIICRLLEILERCGVETINGETNFDRNRHQPERAMHVLSGATVAQTLSPGFRVGRRILRRALVRLQNPSAPGPAS